ncbi:hypothetical protein J4Q44_G00288750 [Coregonus suidteri]|uniref:Uncharacterized protein n=1 Tax=Coregonus suidteri TaxID=861788 RepID=A0AAN8KZZ5_9TELE
MWKEFCSFRVTEKTPESTNMLSFISLLSITGSRSLNKVSIENILERVIYLLFSKGLLSLINM